MITVLFVIFGASVVFMAAFVSPQYGDEIKRRVTHYGDTLQDWLEEVPALIRKMSRGTISFIQKALHMSADSGKKGREKAPF
jgi:hypothetical protein